MRNETAPIIARLGLYTAWGDPSQTIANNGHIEDALSPEDRDTIRVCTPLQLMVLGCDAAESARSHAEAVNRKGITAHDSALSLEISRKAVDYTRAILSELARRAEVNS